jgi:hypothetical protein
MASWNIEVKASPASAHRATTNPAVIRVMRTHPGTSPRSGGSKSGSKSELGGTDTGVGHLGAGLPASAIEPSRDQPEHERDESVAELTEHGLSFFGGDQGVGIEAIRG